MARNKKGQHPARRDDNPPAKPPRPRQGEFFPHAIEFQATYHSGPLPTPKDLHEYNLVEPGAADRIIGMAEREQGHRHEMERGLLRTHSRNSTLGVICGFIFGMSTLGVGVLGVMNGYSFLGGASALGGLATIIAIFVYQQRK
jgi:uncharacterized membrane protein